jgi:hypothetical protein
VIVARDPSLVAEARSHLQAAVDLLRDAPAAVEDAGAAKLALADAALEALFARSSFTHADDQSVIDRYGELYMEDPWAHSSFYGAGYERQALLYEFEGRMAANVSTEGVSAEALQLGFCDGSSRAAESTVDGARRFYAACIDHGAPAWAAICRRKWAALAPWPPRTGADEETAVQLYEAFVAITVADAADCDKMGRDADALATANHAELMTIARFEELSPDDRRGVLAGFGTRLSAIANAFVAAEKACVSSSVWQHGTSIWQDVMPNLVK